jgi:MerR family transcriptional regulator/heat shock protein HspR
MVATDDTLNGRAELDNQPAYVISVAARMVGVHAQTLRYYERVGLMEPQRTGGNIRLYSVRDVQRALWIRSLVEDLGMNLAGVEVMIRMSARLAELEEENRGLRAQIPAHGIRLRTR